MDLKDSGILLRIPGYRDSEFSKDADLGSVRKGPGSMAVSLLCFSMPFPAVHPLLPSADELWWTHYKSSGVLWLSP